MSRPHAAAPASGAALLFLALLLSPGVSSALPPGLPPLTPDHKAALADAANARSVLPWQRQFMRGLSGRPSAPSKPANTTGADGNWTELAFPKIEEPAAVYDPVRQSLLVFGGRIAHTNSYSSDTWELSLTGTPTWTLLETAGDKPAPRSGHALLYDSRRERLLVFGGADFFTRNDFWVLDLTNDPPSWEQVLPSGSLPPRVTYCQAVYDSLNDQVVVFSGADSLDTGNGPITFNDEVWALPVGSPTTWTQLTPSGTPPSPRAGAAVIYDEPRQRMVLFGGYDGNLFDDAFTLSLDSNPAWAPLGATGGPPPARAVPTLAYDAPQDRLVLFGGLSLPLLSDVWELNLAANAWTELVPAGAPPSVRQQAVGVYDAAQDRMVMFGGNSDSTEDIVDPLWALSLGASPEWTDLGSHVPRARFAAASAVDRTRRVLWMHGGTGFNSAGGGLIRQDLLSLPLTGAGGWSEPATSGTPLGRRSGHSAIYDAPRDRLIFFGGEDALSVHNDVWALTLSGTRTWSKLTPSGTPPAARMFHSAVYDAVNQRMVVYGGTTEPGLKNDVWALSLAGAPAWTELLPTGTPPTGRLGQSGTLDEWGNRLIVYGGSNGSLSDSVYALTLSGSPAWELLLPTGTPPPNRFFASMVGIGSRAIVTGGNGNTFAFDPLNDTWLLSLYPPSWRQLDVGPVLPAARLSHVAGFDYPSFALTVFSGLGDTTTPDTWSLGLDQVVPALVSLVSANARAGRVELAWEVSEALDAATVERSTDGATWEVLGSVLQDGSGRLAYVDLDVVAGARYGYRLALPDGTKSPAAWVEIPVAANFALRGMTPNPATGSTALVAFTLPDASPARLEVMDIAGRQVFAREVGSLGPGQHFVRVSGDSPLAPGVYLVRLSRGGQSLTAKAVATR